MSTFFFICVKKCQKSNFKLKCTKNERKGNFKIFVSEKNIILVAKVIFCDAPTTATKRQLNRYQSFKCLVLIKSNTYFSKTFQLQVCLTMYSILRPRGIKVIRCFSLLLCSIIIINVSRNGKMF